MFKGDYYAVFVLLIFTGLTSTVFTAMSSTTSPYSVDFDLRDMSGFSDNVISADDIVAFIREKAPNSPMLSEADIGSCFINAGLSNDVNPAFLVATACLEGVFGTAGWAISHPECHNTFGYGIPSGSTQPDDINCMDSWCVMTQRVASVIAHGHNYYTQDRYTVSQVRTKYLGYDTPNQATIDSSNSIASLMNELYTFSINRKASGSNASVEAPPIKGQQASQTNTQEAASKQQPSGVELNTNGESKIFWVFDTSQNEWHVTGGPGSFDEKYNYGHCGDDYYANDWARLDHNQEGQPIYAGISGIVYTFDYESAWGKEVIIYDPSSKFALRYAHLDEYDESINGTWISATSNVSLGKVGRTGPYGTGPHLHLVLYKNVSSIDKGNPVRISSCTVLNGACVKSATKYAAEYSFVPRPAGAEPSTASQQPTKPPITLSLYVHEGDQNGPAIPGAQVTGQDGSGNNFSQTSDSNGYMTIDGTPGEWSFTASASGYATNSWSQSITDTRAKHAFLQKEIILTLYVHEGDQNGPVLSGAQVTGQDGSDKSFSRTTCSDGWVIISGTPGTWSFTASTSGYETNSWSQSITDTCTKHASLQPKEYDRINEYVDNASATKCTPGSVSAKCSSPDACVGCDGKCVPSGTDAGKGWTCDQGKWDFQPKYLSDIGTYRSTFDQVRYDSDASVKIGNTAYDKGVQLYIGGEGILDFLGHDKNYVAYFNLNKTYSCITGLVGLDDKTGSSAGNVTVVFGGDGNDIQTISLTPGDLPIEVNIDVSGVQRLTVETPYSTKSAYIDLINMNLDNEECKVSHVISSLPSAGENAVDRAVGVPLNGQEVTANYTVTYGDNHKIVTGKAD